MDAQRTPANSPLHRQKWTGIPIGWLLLALVMLSGCHPLDGDLLVDLRVDEQQGAAGVGDPLYPFLGNGGYDVQHYAIDLAVDVAANRIVGSTTITALATQDLAAFNLDFAGLTVDSISVNGDDARHVRRGSELTIHPTPPLAEGEAFTVTVAYHGSPTPLTDDSVGIDTLGWQRQPGGLFAASEPNGSMNWFPGNNHPADKATYTFRITAPESNLVAANGALVDQITADGQTTFLWEMDAPMASYLATIHIGAYDIEREVGPNGVIIRNYFPVETPADVRDQFDVTGEMMRFMQETIGPYPFDRYGVALLTIDVPWALETQTLSTFSANGSDEETIAHELAHQWFGNSVSPATWADIWLNEGFSSYFHLLWIAESKGQRAFDAEMARIYGRLKAIDAGPLIPVEPAELFGVTVYFRGAWALHALRLAVGDKSFFEIVRTYYARHAYGNASTDDLLAIVTEVGGAEAEALLRDWIYSPQLPPEPAD